MVALFRETNQNNIDDVVVQAKNQLRAETIRANRGHLEQLFYGYLERLQSRGCPKQILEMACERKNEVVVKASEMSIPEEHIPFVGPIIKPAYLGYYGLMSMVRNGDKEGYIYLDPLKIADTVSTPDGLYWLYDVEDGEAVRGKASQDAEKLIKKEGRLGLTATEVVNLGILTDVLSKHYVNAVGSRFDSDRVPYLYFFDGRPELYWFFLDYGDDHWGAASCGSRG